jgi:hypothetical protein
MGVTHLFHQLIYKELMSIIVHFQQQVLRIVMHISWAAG